ncbi:HAD family hydrolase [Paludibacterium purpuratum]|uniref:phosphoglycolate phosphatase n=1 Tax=Paludibacterium purpuratum TaxID=1144873 RepID=A0A4R7AZN3_9NEIS|nr:HAD hydrolase-like protein [Paludibacterium purpuratum]TDR73901.1 phosphoglycolate phosphatase-like HAD superfamily hydrolase [Paludibacterium purpuratum]
MNFNHAIALLDFDGTLMDSMGDLVGMTLETLSHWGLSAASHEVESLMGQPTETRLRHHGMPADQLAHATAFFRKLHAQSRYARSQPMAGAERWLASTPHLRKWVVSASPESAVRAGLKWHGLDRYFEHVMGAPAASNLDKVAALAPYRGSFAKACCWFLGDQQGDAEAAASIGARFALMHNPRNTALVPLAARVLTNFESLLETSLEGTWNLSLSSHRP